MTLFGHFQETDVSSVMTDGSSSLNRSCRDGMDLSMLYILIRSLSGDTDGTGFALSKDDDSDFNTLEASLWNTFVRTV